jgi:hypothetical protein
MKPATLLIALLVFQSGGFACEKYHNVKSRSAHAVTQSGASGFNNDLTGKLLLTDRQKASSRKLDISALSPGVYLLRIITDANSLCEKIIIR